MAEERTLELTKAVLPIGAALGGLIIIAGVIMFIVGNAANTGQNTKDIEALTTRVNTIDIAQQSLSNKQAVLEVKIDTILDRIQDIKATLDKAAK